MHGVLGHVGLAASCLKRNPPRRRDSVDEPNEGAVVQLRGSRRVLVTLGAGLALLTAAAVGNAAPALAGARTGPAAATLRGPGSAGASDAVLPGPPSSGSQPVTVSNLAHSSSPAIAPLRRLLPADLFVVAPTTLSPA